MDRSKAYKNLFMMCEKVDESAFSELKENYHVRTCKEEELTLWKEMQFDTKEEIIKYGHTVDNYFTETYKGKEDLFFKKNQFVCNHLDQPIACCFIWKSYNMFNTVQWLKVNKYYEGQGIGRALLTLVLKELEPSDYPVYLSTQTRNYRAIKLYNDFGFCVLSDEMIGNRKNDLVEALPILKEYMPINVYRVLKICQAPKIFKSQLKTVKTIEF